MLELWNRNLEHSHVNKFNNIEISLSRSSIVIADIDHFKNVNDLYGHLVGDHVLVEITKIMQSLIQKDDIVARWGGEEFIFYFGNKSLKETFENIEEIRKEIQKTKIIYSNEEINVTCTFGICHIEKDFGLNDCIKAADESMYEGKAKGRNSTVVAHCNRE